MLTYEDVDRERDPIKHLAKFHTWAAQPDADLSDPCLCGERPRAMCERTCSLAPCTCLTAPGPCAVHTCPICGHSKGRDLVVCDRCADAQ